VFVLRRGQPVRRVELGPAAPIEQALKRWRQDILKGHDSEAAEKLRALLWDGLAVHLGADTDTVYLRPEGLLSALPWAALPGRRKGSVLLEDHAIALVPHGPFLLERLRDRSAPGGPATLVALGSAAYDQAPAAVKRSGAPARLRAPDTEGRKLRWEPLPGTAAELDAVLTLAGKVSPRPRLLALRGREAGTSQLLAALPEARWAHLATHGFLAVPRGEVRKELLDDRLFEFGFQRERRGVGARNPLVQSGLVLAGANLPRKGPEDDPGILTAEAIAGLNLDRLQLVVLSACETGVGEVAGPGEGVFGLQRAFHLAGARDVVASLWKVDDEPTAALMRLFYHHLWQKGEAPLQALRKAQLTLYRNPGEIRALARERGPDFTKTVRRVTQPAARPPAGQPRATAPVRHWAAFVLSGPGR
jgi:CHAT domain-containing protein